MTLDNKHGLTRFAEPAKDGYATECPESLLPFSRLRAYILTLSKVKTEHEIDTVTVSSADSPL